jgi:hypothetical protein
MTTTLLRKSLAAVAASALAAAALSLPLARDAVAQTISVDFPTPEFMATVQPIYYENHAVYWWHNHWLWRDGASWRSYDHEPPVLEQRRTHDPPGRWFYGPKDAHGSGNFGHDARGGHGGHEAPAHPEHAAPEHAAPRETHGKR